MQFVYNSNVFGSCIIHILYTGCAKIKKNNSSPKRLMTEFQVKTYCSINVEGNMSMDGGGLIGHSQNTDKAYYSEIIGAWKCH